MILIRTFLLTRFSYSLFLTSFLTHFSFILFLLFYIFFRLSYPYPLSSLSLFINPSSLSSLSSLSFFSLLFFHLFLHLNFSLSLFLSSSSPSYLLSLFFYSFISIFLFSTPLFSTSFSLSLFPHSRWSQYRSSETVSGAGEHSSVKTQTATKRQLCSIEKWRRKSGEKKVRLFFINMLLFFYWIFFSYSILCFIKFFCLFVYWIISILIYYIFFTLIFTYNAIDQNKRNKTMKKIVRTTDRERKRDWKKKKHLSPDQKTF